MSVIAEDSKGFTIVELLVTLIVGGLLAGSVAIFLSLHTHVAQRGRDVSVANSYAENKIESLRSAGYLGLSNGTTTITPELPSELNSPRSGSMVISDQSTSIKRVSITITYSDQGAPRTYTYSTFIGELGVGQY
jgi:prepilin-type N-terminal cleavage/methylation domain-containing protein